MRPTASALLSQLARHRRAVDALALQVETSPDRPRPILIGLAAALQNEARQTTEAVGAWMKDAAVAAKEGAHA